MPVKFQFQFAGADFSRPSSPQRKWLRVGLMSAASALAVLAYWGYLHHLTHGHAPVVAHVSAVVAKPLAAEPAKPVVPVAPATMPTALKNVANASVAAVGNYLMQAVKISPAVPVAANPAPSRAVTSGSAAQPVTTSVAAPVVVVSKPVAPRTYRVRSEQDRFLMAGQVAFANVIELAGKYPDSYGFQAGDFLSDAKLGTPIPVYTIEESARANYRAGQPVKPLLKAAKQWVFPVLMGDRVCCMVEVKQTGRDYVPGKGNKSLAMAWNKIQQKWPVAEGYHPMLLVNAEVPGYYFTVPELPVQNITDTVEMFYYNPGTSPADVILASWR